MALALFDDLAGLHLLPASARPVLEAAALLHDVGSAVSYGKHHKHTHYLIANGDIPGFSERERQLVALVARYHRRSPPDRERPDLATLPPSDFRMVRKSSTTPSYAIVYPLLISSIDEITASAMNFSCSRLKS